MRVVKGHGTENDFVLVPDLDGEFELSPALVRALCDRHAGIGADGVLRIVRSAKHPESVGVAAEAPYFMDYRNADGSVAEMCGNGVRVFMRYLQRAGLAGDELAVATRGGIKQVRTVDGEIMVAMGRPVLGTELPTVTPAHGRMLAATATVEMPNPHVVVWVDSAEELAGLELGAVPVVQPSRPDGQNVEFVQRLGPRRLRMRVHERGVGETRSCGTGICAVVVAAATEDRVGADAVPWQVDVPGGTCRVTWRGDGEIELTGPAVLVAEIELDEHWLASAAR